MKSYLVKVALYGRTVFEREIAAESSMLALSAALAELPDGCPRHTVVRVTPKTPIRFFTQGAVSER